MATYTVRYTNDDPVVSTIDCDLCEDGYIHLEDSTQIPCGKCDATGSVEVVEYTNVQTHTHEFSSTPTFADTQAVVDTLTYKTIIFQGFE